MVQGLWNVGRLVQFRQLSEVFGREGRRRGAPFFLVTTGKTRRKDVREYEETWGWWEEGLFKVHGTFLTREEAETMYLQEEMKKGRGDFPAEGGTGKGHQLVGGTEKAGGWKLGACEKEKR